VQYHPEYDYVDIAAAAERYGETLVKEGMFSDRRRSRRLPANFAPAAELLRFGAAWKHGLGPACAARALRLLEIRNWLEAQCGRARTRSA